MERERNSARVSLGPIRSQPVYLDASFHIPARRRSLLYVSTYMYVYHSDTYRVVSAQISIQKDSEINIGNPVGFSRGINLDSINPNSFTYS